MSVIYHTFIFNPLYNILVELFNLLPWIDAGIAVILLTVITRLILFPLSKKSVLAQVKMREVAPLLEELKVKYKDKPDVQAKETMKIYKEKGVNPFSGIFLILLQLPIILALYRIFLHAGFPNIDASLLYSFVHIPSKINIEFLGLINITEKSILLALLAAISAFFQLKLAAGNVPPPTSDKNSFGNDLAKSMQTQMKYFFPIIVFLISYKISGVIALYWLTSNLFTIGQEIWVQKKYITVV